MMMQKNIKKIFSDYSVLVALIILFVISSIIRGNEFLSINNITNILRNSVSIGIITIGMTAIIILGGIDLSVGSMMVLCGVVILAVINMTNSIVLGIMAGILLGVVLGALTGAIIAKGKLPAFIVTLGAMSIYRSVAQYVLKGGGIISANKEYQLISNYEIFNWSLSIFYWIILVLIAMFFMKYTRLGRYIYSVGSNEKATRFSGINVDKVKIATYALGGLFVALAAVVESSRLGSINSSSSGVAYEMDAIAAVVVGGTSMAGGKGAIFGTFAGMLILGIMNNMMTLLGIPPFLVGAVKGSIIILAVLFQKKDQ
ncbi:monosaccharide ABC transporter membrane protein, CUT2 family [Pelosinus fermentans]|uniref:ABC transporter permease n=1 Tax=Pelosinus fermentans TaxID=365349 RepID=UPI0002684645|nr:ABC transporter permease [Pelosinus fermentans]OAM92533.1 ABC-type transporter, integral membrane subunit [Pelosinus fermentans DSM 17108]SDQ48065.1 monosaccharide ABC transporter membrane protein, CUT2 family [Pelosinus fermentans]